jgi:hypothetical protein
LHGWSSEAGNAAGENESACRTDPPRALQELESTLQIHADRVIKAFFALPADHRGQVKDHDLLGALGPVHSDRLIDCVLGLNASDNLQYFYTL